MKIEIENSYSGGPEIFLSRLKRELINMNISGRDITLSTSNIQTTNNFVLRLDGLNFEKFTLKELELFLKYRNDSFKLKLFQKVLGILPENYFNGFISPKLTDYLFHLRNKNQILGIKNADYIVYQSKFSRDSYKFFCEDYGENKHEIIYNGVDLDLFSPIKSKNIFKDSTFNILVSGSFRPWKRLQDSVILMKYLLEDITDLKLYILGNMDNQTSTYVNNIIEKLDLKENIDFLGNVKPDSLPIYYASADVLLHPAWHDPCPNVVIESLASGNPVICSNCGGTPELVGSGGHIVEESYDIGFKEYYNFEKIPNIDFLEYKNCLLDIYDNKSIYSKKARKRAVNNFDIKNIAKNYIDVFKKVSQ